MGFVNIHGQPWSPSSQSTTARPKAAKDKPKQSHKGFRVVGFPPGALERAKEWAEKEWGEWSALTEQQKAERIKQGTRHPKPWDEDAWKQRTKPVAVRAKPYGVPEAADTCAALASKAGWLCVRVVELKKDE